MKGPWKVTSNIIGGEKVYAVYRLLDTSETDHSGNREIGTPYTTDRQLAEQAAKELNGEA